MAKETLEQRSIYYIPENFTEGGGMVAGLFPIRRVIEAVILAIPGLFLAIKLPLGLEGTIVAIALLAAPLAALGLYGINGDNVSTFLMYFIKFRLLRRKIMYNPRVKTEFTGALDVGERELPRERLAKLLGGISERENANNDNFFADDTNVVFIDDLELKKKIEKTAKGDAKNGNV